MVSKAQQELRLCRNAAQCESLVHRPRKRLHAVMLERIGERHASACRYKNTVPEGSRHSARRTYFWPCGVYFAPLGLWSFVSQVPRALPWDFKYCAIGTESEELP